MKTARNGAGGWPAGPPGNWPRAAGEGSSVSNESICEPKKLRDTVQSRPPSRAWPPSFCPTARSAKKIRPAQVPHTGRPDAMNCLSGSICLFASFGVRCVLL